MQRALQTFVQHCLLGPFAGAAEFFFPRQLIWMQYSAAPLWSGTWPGRQTSDFHKTLISINLSDAPSLIVIEFSLRLLFLIFIFWIRKLVSCLLLIHAQAEDGRTEFRQVLLEWRQPGSLLAWQGCQGEEGCQKLIYWNTCSNDLPRHTLST